MAERSGDEIEMTRASLAAKASHWQARLEQSQAEFDACRAGPERTARGTPGPWSRPGNGWSTSGGWQQRVDEAAGEFRGPAGAFWDLLQNDLPRAESLLLALIADLEAARRVQAGAS